METFKNFLVGLITVGVTASSFILVYIFPGIFLYTLGIMGLAFIVFCLFVITNLGKDLREIGMNRKKKGL